MANKVDAIAAQVESLRKAREEMELTMQVMAQDWSKINGSISSVLQQTNKIVKVERDIVQAKKVALKHQQEYDDLMANSLRLGRQLTTEEQKQVDVSKQLAKDSLKKLDTDQKVVDAMKSQLSLTKGIMGSIGNIVTGVGLALTAQLMSLPGFLNDADKAIRQLNLSLGNSGSRSSELQQSMVAGSMYAGKFNLSVADMAKAQGRMMEMTGKVASFSEAGSKSIVDMAKGTALGAEGAAEMAGHFDTLGISVERTGQIVEGIVQSAADMGVNASNVLKDVNKNFARSQEFTFMAGVAGLKQMAINAQKTRISMEATFNAADKARTLKGSLEMASQLMVLGGNFAKADPFQLSFLARNDPAKFNTVLADMTKGMASFNKETGEMSISAYDMDRLRAASEATNIPLEKLVESSKKMASMSAAKSSLFVGTDSDREMIAQMAKMGSDGTFSVKLGGVDVAVNKLTMAQVSSLKAEKQTLEQRARDAQSFDEVFSGTMMQLKSVFLPLLTQFDSVLKTIKGFLDGLDVSTVKMIAVTGAVIGAVAGLSLILGPMKSLFSVAKGIGGGIGSMLGGGAGKAASSVASAAGNAVGGGAGGGLGGLSGGMSKIAGGAGSSTAATLVAVGVAAVGMGYGVKLATEGIAGLATAMKGMTGPEVAGLVGIVLALSLGFVAMAVGVASFANPASLAGLAVVAGLSLSLIGMGFAIKLATDGIGDMFKSMSSLAGADLSGVAAFFKVATGFLTADDKNFGGLMATVAMLKASQTSIMTEMREIMSTPIVLQLAGDSKMVVNVDVINNMDGDKFVTKYSKAFAVELQKATKGLRSPK